jgi:glycosyltransferase involved in cell wall biosynthesis
MRIALDYTPAISQGAGIARYTRDLVQALGRLDTADQYLLFSTEPPAAERVFPEGANLQQRVIPLGRRNMTLLWQRLRVPVPVELFIGRADVVHGTDFILPPVAAARRVVTIHDLAYLTHPQCALPSLVAYLTAVVPRAVRAADRIIAVSQRTADDLVERLAVPRDKIRVIHLGISPAFSADRDEGAVKRLRQDLGLRDPFVLAVGTIEPRKDYETLIKAFAAARHEPDGPKMLVIAGRPGWLYEGVYAAVERLRLGDAVRFLDYVPDADLSALYHAASAVAMPSIYEGFGIPLVEAMACGTPLVCSTGGSLPEIAGDAALLVPPGDVDALAQAVARIVRDDDLRATLRARGLERARHFTWERAAAEHVEVYREATRGAVGQLA